MPLSELLRTYRPHRELVGETLINKLLSASTGEDPWRLDLSEAERGILGAALAEDAQAPSPLEVDRAIVALGVRRLTAQARQITKEISKSEAEGDWEAVTDWLVAKRLIERVLETLEE